ncbi:MAG: hypothetical protein A2060_07325 [Planctomycetes bacterium GWA2_50_13]|nr:MAG: hypothetical protein A2060_07325 [Planctomycetes bacterium GWA2_50_13]OHB94864.1 MAG: hypothetical protein A3I59_05060 [Planctomycetes bacterium RIFCSPLOWO2_02_FULL_50_16]HCN20262.1 hypothetical protein [Planctomycetia bacterium]
MKEKVSRVAARYLPCACLLDSVQDTVLYSNWINLFVGGLFFIGALIVLIIARKRGYLDFKDMEDIKYKIMDD